ncbi:DUF4190 domain-containing protein [Eubacterium xylanophilum]|uniref:DUF4190 domain-containing protein n=1 Tax=Eubacterium xylanophilum TaxID=39497 RepID=UPI0004B0EFB1|nr:DUF4190 domain-containing protein [Eubacterium xylanophilum]
MENRENFDQFETHEENSTMSTSETIDDSISTTKFETDETSYDKGENRAEESHGLSVASMITGIMAIVVPYVGLITGILAIVFFAIHRKKNNGETNGLAKAGLITGIIGIVVVQIIIFITIIALVSIPNLERSRESKDLSTLDTIASAASVVIANDGTNIDYIDIEVESDGSGYVKETVDTDYEKHFVEALDEQMDIKKSNLSSSVCSGENIYVKFDGELVVGVKGDPEAKYVKNDEGELATFRVSSGRNPELERSRESKDLSTIDTIASAASVAIANVGDTADYVDIEMASDGSGWIEETVDTEFEKQFVELFGEQMDVKTVKLSCAACSKKNIYIKYDGSLVAGVKGNPTAQYATDSTGGNATFSVNASEW